MVSRFFLQRSLFQSSHSSERMHFGLFSICIGSIKGIYDLQGNFYVHGGSRNSGLNGCSFLLDSIIALVILLFPPLVNCFFTVTVLGASPTLVNATSSRAPPPSSMGNMAGGVSMSRSLNSGRGVLSQGILQQQGTP